MTTEVAPRVSREILEDRWRIAIEGPDDGWTRPMKRLDRALIALQEAVVRWPWTGEADPTSDRPDLDGTGAVHEAVHEAVRTTMLDEIERRGIAR
jgi:hypothetical protein